MGKEGMAEWLVEKYCSNRKTAIFWKGFQTLLSLFLCFSDLVTNTVTLFFFTVVPFKCQLIICFEVLLTYCEYEKKQQ